MSFQLFNPGSPEYEQLQEMIEDVERMVFTEEQIEAGLSLYDIEMATESNYDYYSYFEREDTSVQVSKFDIERELNKIKMWLYARVRERAVSRKFRKYR